jgi:hypothetical protein
VEPDTVGQDAGKKRDQVGDGDVEASREQMPEFRGAKCQIASRKCPEQGEMGDEDLRSLDVPFPVNEEAMMGDESQHRTKGAGRSTEWDRRHCGWDESTSRGVFDGKLKGKSSGIGISGRRRPEVADQGEAKDCYGTYIIETYIADILHTIP